MGDYIEPASDSELSTHDRLRMLGQRVDSVIDRIEQIEERLQSAIENAGGPAADKIEDHEKRISSIESLNTNNYDIDVLADEVDTLKSNADESKAQAITDAVEEFADSLRGAAGDLYDSI